MTLLHCTLYLVLSTAVLAQIMWNTTLYTGYTARPLSCDSDFQRRAYLGILLMSLTAHHLSRRLLATLCLLPLPLLSFAQTLEQALAFALAQNPNITISTQERVLANAQLDEAKAGYLPRLNLDAGVGVAHTRNPVASEVFHNSPDTLVPSLIGLELRENLFHGFQTQYQVAAAKARAKAMGLLNYNSANDLALNISRSYLNIIRDQALLRLANQNLTRAQTLLRDVRTHGTQGLKQTADMSRASDYVAEALTQQFAAQNQLATDRSVFVQLVGQEPQNLSLPVIPLQSGFPTSEAQANAQALAQHPLIQVAQAELDMAKSDFQASKSTNMPALDLVLATNQDHNVHGLRGVDTNTNAMLELKYNLFRGGADHARQVAAASRLMMAEARLEQTKRAVVQAMTVAWNRYITLHKELSYLQKQQTMSFDTFNAYQQQYRAGHRSLTEALFAAQRDYQASQNYEIAITNRILSQLEVSAAMGTLLPVLHLPSPPGAITPNTISTESRVSTSTPTYYNNIAPATTAAVNTPVNIQPPTIAATNVIPEESISPSTTARLTLQKPMRATRQALTKTAPTRPKTIAEPKKLTDHMVIANTQPMQMMMRPAATEEAADASVFHTATVAESTISPAIEPKQSTTIASSQSTFTHPEMTQQAQVAPAFGIAKTTKKPKPKQQLISKQQPTQTSVASQQYTVQLMGDYTLSPLKHYAIKKGITKEAAFYVTELHGRTWYVLGIGEYNSFDKAKAVLQQLPPQLKDRGAWIRPLNPT